MDTSLDLIRAKISELEQKLTDLRIAERELIALGTAPTQKTRFAPKLVTAPEETTKVEPEASEEAGSQQTIGTTVTEILGQHGSLTVPAIAEHVASAGRDISNRAISFALQALKKRGLVKSAGGEWTLIQSRRKRARG